MTPEQAKKFLPIVTAYAEGKQIQLKCGGGWLDFADLDFTCAPADYRIKPTPTLRPWRPEEVPVGALLRRRFKPNNIVVILAANTVGNFPSVIVDRQNFDGITALYLGDLLSYHGGHNGDAMEHSLDHGKTWLPCGVAE